MPGVVHRLNCLTRSKLVLVCALAGTLSLSCVPASRTPQRSDPSARARSSSIQPSLPASSLPADDELLVGDDDGLWAFRNDGSGKRLISAGTARAPRMLDATSVLVVRPVAGTGLERGAKLEKVSLRDGTRKLLATVPPLRCKGSKHPVALEIQSADDFQVSPQQQIACLKLMDRNSNMASYALRVTADLQRNVVKRQLTVGAEECQPVDDVSTSDTVEDEDRCNDETDEMDPAAGPPRAFTFDQEQLFRRDESGRRHRVLRLAGYDAGDESPSGRWILLSGDYTEGDYIYLRWLLLDQTSGALYPLPKEPQPFPAPLSVPPGANARLSTPVEQAALIAGETEKRWLGRDQHDELLVVGPLIIRPLKTIFSVQGEVAR